MIQTRRIASGADMDWDSQTTYVVGPGEGFFERFTDKPRLFYPQGPIFDSLVCCGSPNFRVLLLVVEGDAAGLVFTLNDNVIDAENVEGVVYKFMLGSMIDNIVRVSNWNGSATRIRANLLKA